MTGEVCSLLFAIIFVPLMILGWMNILHSLRMSRVRRLLGRLSGQARDQILNHIDATGREGYDCTVLACQEPTPAPAPDDVVSSHYGGAPYAQEGDSWPKWGPDKPDPADFLIQVRLDDTFPAPWSGRLLVVFTAEGVDQTIRCYSSPTVDQFVPLEGGPAPQREWKLRPIRIPRQHPPAETAVDQAAEPKPEPAKLLDYDPVVLLKTVPGLKQDLAPHARRPADLLAAVLAPNHCGYGFELSDIVQLGGDPVWLQFDLGGLDCDRCGKELRFLFQFGDLNGGPLLGDAGVCYVFGCDDHLDELRAIMEN